MEGKKSVQAREYELELIEVVQETSEVKLFRFIIPKDFYFYPGEIRDSFFLFDFF